MSGRFGTVSTPLALITKRAVTESPESSSTVHRSASSSNTVAVTLVENRILRRSPYLRTQRSA